eukprot:jgi/Bigna1/77811/fgenesh1_pg.50_\
MGSKYSTAPRISSWKYDAANSEWIVHKSKKRKEEKKLVLNDEFTVLTYNIWFGRVEPKERFKEIGAMVGKYDPDVVMFQEVESWIIKLFLAQEWAKQYYITDPDGRTIERYGVMMFSKVPFSEVINYPFPASKLGRKMLMATIPTSSGPPLLVGTFHLDSFPNMKAERKSEVEDMCELAMPFKRVLCAGDTNFIADEEKQNLDKGKFLDVWETLKPDEHGATFSTKDNLMTRKSAEGLYEAHNRIDRMWYTQGTMKPLDITLIGTKAIRNDESSPLWPSDHYGLVSKLKFAKM